VVQARDASQPALTLIASLAKPSPDPLSKPSPARQWHDFLEFYKKFSQRVMPRTHNTGAKVTRKPSPRPAL